ncbi:hypothetical protein LAV82_17705 [Bacillus sp. ILBB4]|nr:hypothetical protein [Bacillus sp. ILBB4]
MTDNNVGFGVSGNADTKQKTNVSSEATMTNKVKHDNYEVLNHQLNSVSDDAFRADRDED